MNISNGKWEQIYSPFKGEFICCKPDHSTLPPTYVCIYCWVPLEYVCISRRKFSDLYSVCKYCYPFINIVGTYKDDIISASTFLKEKEITLEQFRTCRDSILKQYQKVKKSRESKQLVAFKKKYRL